MESRKIVKSGKTSFIISLPVDWVRRHHLKAGGLIYLSENYDGDMLLTPFIETKQTMKRAAPTAIKVDGKDLERINLELMLAYLRDAPSISIEGKELKEKREEISARITEYIGFETMEESDKAILVKNFFILDQETSPRALIRRMDVIARASFRVLTEEVKHNFSKDEELELQKYHEQTRRLFLVVKKVLLKLIEEPSLMKEHQTNTLQLSLEKSTAATITEVSGVLYEFGQTLFLLDTDTQGFKDLRALARIIAKEYQDTITLTMNKELEGVNHLLVRSVELEKQLENFYLNWDEALVIQGARSLRRIILFLRSLVEETLI